MYRANNMHKWMFFIVFASLLFSGVAYASPVDSCQEGKRYIHRFDGWYYHCVKLEGIDSGTFHILSGKDSHIGILDFGPEYAVDKFHVYWWSYIILGADPATFLFVGNSYARDADHVYWGGRTIKGADPKSFRVSVAGSNGAFTAEDQNYYFYHQDTYKKSECRVVGDGVLACKDYIVTDGIQCSKIDPVSFHYIGRLSNACGTHLNSPRIYQDKHGVYAIEDGTVMKFNFLADRIFANLDNTLEARLCSSGATYVERPMLPMKPVIYLYPPKAQEIFVKLLYQGKITSSFPEYDNNIKGWGVMAFPDGHLVNLADKAEYSYLFWEGSSDKEIVSDFTEGFIVAGKDTASFLQKILKEFGLTPREYNEFIVYWMPKMKDNKYNLIHFAGKEYEDTARLDIQPNPDSLLRVFMVYKSIDSKVEIVPQDIKPFIRKGFTVVEWGGTEVAKVSEEK